MSTFDKIKKPGFINLFSHAAIYYKFVVDFLIKKKYDIEYIILPKCHSCDI